MEQLSDFLQFTMKFIRIFVQVNRNVTNLFKSFTSKMFGDIDASESYFYSRISGFTGKRVVEIGGANRPLFLKAALDEYVGVDIDTSFNWDGIYSRYYAQSCEDILPDRVLGDLVVSKYVLEHIADNRKTFLNITKLMANDGVSVHLIPLGFHPFSIANRIVGNRFAKVIIPFIRPGTEHVTGYPAYYHLCNSFQLEQVAETMGCNYEIKYFYGAEDYFGFFAPLGCMVNIFNRCSSFFGIKILASTAVLCMWKQR